MKPIQDQSGKQQLGNAAPAKRRASRNLPWIVVGIVLAASIGWSLVMGRPPWSPLMIASDGGGIFTPTVPGGGEDDRTADRSLEAAKLNADNGFFASHTSSYASHAGFACRRVVIMNESDHPLLVHVGEALPQRISSLEFVDDVKYLAADESLPLGTKSPDLWISLDLDRIETSGLIPRRTVEADITVNVGSSLATGRNSVHDSSSPPIVESNWQGKLEHRSTVVGLTTDKFARVGENVLEVVANHVTKHLQKLHEDHGPAPSFQAAFYPGYTKTPTLFQLEDQGGKLVSSTHGMMFGNETFWRVTLEGAPAALFTTLQDRAEQAGWTTRVRNETSGQEHLSLTHNEDRFDIFVARQAVQRNPQTASSANAAAPKVLYARYVDRLSRTELQSAASRQLDEGGPLAALLGVSRYFDGEQRKQYFELLETRYASSPAAWTTLADEYARRKQPDRAQEAVRRAHWLAKFDPASKNHATAIKKLAKKLKVNDLHKARATIDLLRTMGLTEIVAGESTSPVEIGLNEPALFFVTDDDQNWQVLNFRIQRFGNNNASPRYKMATATVSPNSSSWSSGRLLPTGEISTDTLRLNDIGSVTLEIAQQPDERFQIVGQLEPK